MRRCAECGKVATHRRLEAAPWYDVHGEVFCAEPCEPWTPLPELARVLLVWSDSGQLRAAELELEAVAA